MDDLIPQILANDFHSFAQAAFTNLNPGIPWQDNWNLECICEHLQALERGDFNKLIINLPPRSLKSFLCGVAFPAWVLGRTPNTRFIQTSYSFTLATLASATCRDLLNSDFCHALFPHVALSPTQNQKHHWETVQRGQYYAASALGTITGVGCDYLLLDDPLKPMEAFSEAIRTSTNANIRGTLFSRFNNQLTGKFLMIMQRVHEDDPTGHLLRDGGYTLLKLPAETKTSVHIRLKTPNGELTWDMPPNSLLFPARLNREVLDRMRLDMTETNYAGQMLQEPVPVGGGEFKNEWVQYYHHGSINPKTMNIAILCDPASGDEINKKKKKLTDWTAFLVVGLAPDNNYYLLDIIRDRLNPTERVDTLFMLHRKWNALSGKPPKVGYEKYGMMTDTHYIEEKKKHEAYHFPLIELGGSMMKEERIRRLIPDLQQGRWYFPANLMYVDNENRQFDLISELVNSEMTSFPKARFDDMLDALSRVYEADLHLSFPRLQATLKQSMLNEISRQQESESWMEF